ncbi:MFS transporter [Actinophytocola oryzae]|uniref:MFS transporter n=1 Tax=Actinophytocola oryzae TaxID=502181 RepID=A0A4V3FV36_9PSEU|nr:MFS transporter [Actinophytocola oryzae]TDV57431.1 MFS transporter [Actinophytocola oryzae]
MTGRAATALAAGLEPLRDGRFRRLLLSMAVSASGSSGTLVALTWLVAVEQGDGDRLGLVLAAYTVPQFVAGLVGGALADRYGTRALSRAGHLTAGGALLALWLFSAGSAAGVAGIVAVAGTGVALAQPVTGALMVSIVDDRRLGPANMLRTIALDAAAVLGPVSAGVLIAGFGAHAWFLVDAVTFLLAAALLPPPRRAPEEGAPRRLAEAAAGLRFVVGRRPLWTGMVAAGLGNLLVTVPLLVGVPTMVGSLGSTALGGFFALFTAGSVLGAAEAGLVARRRPMRAALAFLLLAGVGTALLGSAPDAARYCLAAGIGFCVAGFDVRWAAYLQGRVPGELMGRVLAGDAWASFVCRTVGFATLGLVAVRSPGGVLLVCGLVMAASAAAFLAGAGGDS